MSILLGLGGFAESGKDTFADGLCPLEGSEEWLRTFFSEPLKESLMTLNPVVGVTYEDNALLGYPFPNRTTTHWTRFATVVHQLGYDRAKKIPEVRDLLIRMGTEVGRNQFGQSFWSDMAEKKIREALTRGKKAVVTGVRFSNEINMIHRYGGITVWVSRPNVGPVRNHQSEGLGPEDFDVQVENDGTPEDLHVKAWELVESMKVVR